MTLTADDRDQESVDHNESELSPYIETAVGSVHATPIRGLQ
jgi:hypothetical protein